MSAVAMPVVPIAVAGASVAATVLGELWPGRDACRAEMPKPRPCLPRPPGIMVIYRCRIDLVEFT